MTDTTSIEQRLRELFELVAEKEPVDPAPIDANTWREQTQRATVHQGHHVLVGALVAVVVVAAAVVAIVYGPRSSSGSQTGALTNGPTVVGSYSMTYVDPRTPSFNNSGWTRVFINHSAVRLKMMANGTFTVPGYELGGSDNSGNWMDAKGTVTLKFSLPASTHSHGSLVQTIRQLGSNLGSASRPGVVRSNGKQIEKWYAVRVQGRSGYESAKAQWMGDALVAATGSQDAPLQLAVADLHRGEDSDAGNTSGYGGAIAAIKKFEDMPITSVTPAIAAQENGEIATINRFFGLPPSPWSGECDSSGPGKRTAGMAWETEPVQSLSGVTVAALKKAVTDLRHGLTTDRGDTSCYPAAIVDLLSLESATSKEMTKNVPYGYEIDYLNQFFHGHQYVLGGPDNAVVPK